MQTYTSRENSAQVYKHEIDFFERQLIEGHIHVNEQNGFFYDPAADHRSVPMYMASSMVNEIAPIVLALTDSRAYEIEASLHPQKQLELVRFLNRLSNKGIQLILSTHSDLKTRMQNRRCPGMQGRCFSKEMDTLIFDVKSNISAFSDDLLKDNAMLTAIKEIRDFAEQIHAEILHKNSLMTYKNEAKRIREVSEKTVRIHEKAYPLKVVLLEVYRTVHFAEKNGTD